MRPWTRTALACAVAPGLGLLAAAPAGAQAPPPPPGAVAQTATTYAPIARKMAEEVRRLADTIAADLGRNAGARELIEDARELSLSLDEFRQNQRAGSSPIQTRQDYSSIHSGWQNLHAHLARPGASTPAINQDVEAIDALDAQIAESLGLNPLPEDYYGPPPAPTGIAQTRRLARALVDRAEALDLAIEGDLANEPDAEGCIIDARNLAREADIWHDSLKGDTARAAATRQFRTMDTISDKVEQFVTTHPVTPRIRSAWEAFASVEVLVHRDLGLTSRRPAVAYQFPPSNIRVVETTARVRADQPQPDFEPQPQFVPQQEQGQVVVASPIVELSVQLVQQSEAFVQVYGPTARAVPEGGAILADAQRLLAAATQFHDNVDRGVDPGALAFGFREVDVVWQRLARRVNRVARGRTGPNIQQVAKIGGTCEQIHRALGMPGLAPVLGPFEDR